MAQVIPGDVRDSVEKLVQDHIAAYEAAFRREQ